MGTRHKYYNTGQVSSLFDLNRFHIFKGNLILSIQLFFLLSYLIVVQRQLLY